MRYIVAGCEPWTLSVFRGAVSNGEWSFCHHPDSLRLALSCGLPPPRFIFVLHWRWKVADDITSLECVNFHCTDLRGARGRGGNPIENLILEGHAETTISAHRMTDEIDAGPVYGVSEPISLAGTKDRILARFVEPCAKLIRWIVETEPIPQPQVGEPTYFKRLSPIAYQAFWEQRARG